jgi:hypothetical protein
MGLFQVDLSAFMPEWMGDFGPEAIKAYKDKLVKQVK